MTNTTNSPSSPRALRRQWKRDHGICYDCTLPALPGRRRCLKHTLDARRRQRIYDYDKYGSHKGGQK